MPKSFAEMFPEETTTASLPDVRTSVPTLVQPVEPPPPVDDREQQAALEVCRTQPFVNLSGTAGVGKTWVARQLAEDPSVVLAATTGIASLNLGEGTTINALLRYFDTESMKQAYLGGFLASRLRALRRSGVRKIVLDEKSMLNGEQLTYLVRAIDEVNDTAGYDASLEDEDSPMLPAREMGLILCGDLGQLPPVPDKDEVTQKSKGVQFIFDSPEWSRFADHTVTLQQIRRQTDREFIAALHAVRKGHKAGAMDFFQPHHFHQDLNDSFEGTTIFAKNDAVERYNQLRLDRLQTPPVIMDTVRTGKQRGDWKLVPDRLTLKEGALVMILANRRVYDGEEDQIGQLLYANGDLGVLKGINQNLGWTVELQRGGTVQVLPVTRHNLIPLEVGRKKQLVQEFGVEGAQARIDGRNEIIGAVTYMSLRCAYGCTVHKTQGLSLDNVQVNIRDPFFRQPGMLFVALSRARTAEGLRVIGDQRGFGERCTVDPRVARWL
jgi:ATP-dependent DNA helicase PIF1